MLFASLHVLLCILTSIGSVAQLRNAVCSAADAPESPFVLTARVSLACCERLHLSMAIEDDSDAMLVETVKATGDRPAAGDRIALRGQIATDASGNRCARGQEIRILSHDAPPRPLHPTSAEIAHGTCDFRLVRVEGLVADAFPDEIDPDFMFIFLNCNGHRITITTESDGKSSADCERFIGQQLSVLGVCRPNVFGLRTIFGRNIRTVPENIHVTEHLRPDPFEVPGIGSIHSTLPEEIASPERRLVRGRILATWSNDRALVQSVSGQLTHISISHGELPDCGAMIEATGFPDTDLFRINLTHCLWRPCHDNESPPEPPAKRVTINQLLADDLGRVRYDPTYHGRRIVISGRIRGVVSDEGLHERFLLESGNRTLPVNFRKGLVSELKCGSLVEIDGIFVMDTGTWSPNTLFPHISEVFISIPGPDRLHLLAGPPWWTPSRLLTLIVCLLTVMCGSLLLNYLLRRIVTRRSLELQREITARLESDLKKRERTRLAVELHDSIAQNLSGTAMEIGSAIRFATDDPQQMLAHLNIASKTLHSCRDDLRDCLWDLRSMALEIDDMNEAIRTTLKPYLGDIRLIVRFNVPRHRLSDNTAHAMLRIIRELVSNAQKHGKAQCIRIAGSIDGRRLLFSVQDDGCGFDPSNRPGVIQGHFGLEGIRERVERANGDLHIDSAAGLGTKVTIVLDISPPEEEDLSVL